jgi:hypothetical protein
VLDSERRGTHAHQEFPAVPERHDRQDEHDHEQRSERGVERAPAEEPTRQDDRRVGERARSEADVGLPPAERPRPAPDRRTRLGRITAMLKMPPAIRKRLVAVALCGISMNSDRKSMSPKFARVTRASARTSDLDSTARRCRERPTKSRPTSVAAAVPDTM